MNALQASLVGYRVKELLADRPAGQLHSIHARAAYCSLPLRPLMLIHCTELGGMPFGIGADMETGYLQKAGLERGMQVDISADRLFIPAAGFGIDLGRAKVWRPHECGSGEFSPSRLQANLDHALREVARRCSGAGLGQMIPLLDTLLSADETVQRGGADSLSSEGTAQSGNRKTPGGRELNHLCRACWDPLRQLIRAIREQDFPALTNSLTRLIGLGVGLTPSMDDVIAGLISTLHRASDRIPGGAAWVAAVGSEICMLSVSRTTEVSRNNLFFASSGDRFEILDDLIEALFTSSGGNLNDRIGRLVSCGATSGTELAIGVLLGVKLVLASHDELGS